MKRIASKNTAFGRVYTIRAKGCAVNVIKPTAFDAYVGSKGAAPIEDGKHFRFATVKHGSIQKLFVASRAEPKKEEINQDTAYHRRREVADAAEARFPWVDRKFLRVNLASSVQIASCLYSFEDGTPAAVSGDVHTEYAAALRPGTASVGGIKTARHMGRHEHRRD